MQQPSNQFRLHYGMESMHAVQIKMLFHGFFKGHWEQRCTLNPLLPTPLISVQLNWLHIALGLKATWIHWWVIDEKFQIHICKETKGTLSFKSLAYHHSVYYKKNNAISILVRHHPWECTSCLWFISCYFEEEYNDLSAYIETWTSLYLDLDYRSEGLVLQLVRSHARWSVVLIAAV